MPLHIYLVKIVKVFNFKFLGLYEAELERNKIPRRIKSMLELSKDAKKRTESKHNAIKVIDILLCLFALGSIICAVIDVKLYYI